MSDVLKMTLCWLRFWENVHHDRLNVNCTSRFPIVFQIYSTFCVTVWWQCFWRSCSEH